MLYISDEIKTWTSEDSSPAYYLTYPCGNYFGGSDRGIDKYHGFWHSPSPHGNRGVMVIFDQLVVKIHKFKGSDFTDG